MSDEPQGRFVLKWKGKSIGGKRYHLYRDCGMLAEGAIPEDQAKVLNVSDEMINLLEMQVCSTCDRRARLVDYRDVIVTRAKEFAGEQQGKAETADEGNFEEDAVRFAEQLIGDLEDEGFKIRRVRKS